MPAASRQSQLAHAPRFFPNDREPERAQAAGFRFGKAGTHTSRTLMLAELRELLAAVPAGAKRADYLAAVVDENCLRKSTVATRRLTFQRLSELYALDPSISLFRVLRKLWGLDDKAQEQLALLCGLARDPLLRASTSAVIPLPPNAELRRDELRQALAEVAGERMNVAVLEKVARNVASSWSQAGLLAGRTFKVRTTIEARPTSVTFAVFLATAAGFYGSDVLRSAWLAVLDCSETAGKRLAIEAKKLGLLTVRSVGDAIEFDLAVLESPARRE